MGEKKKYSIVFVTLFAFLFFFGAGISYAIPMEWNIKSLLHNLSGIPICNNCMVALNEFSNSSDSNNDETLNSYSDLINNLNPTESYEVIPPIDGGSEAPPVPEPATIILMGGGLVSMLLRKMKRGG